MSGDSTPQILDDMAASRVNDALDLLEAKRSSERISGVRVLRDLASIATDTSYLSDYVTSLSAVIPGAIRRSNDDARAVLEYLQHLYSQAGESPEAIYTAMPSLIPLLRNPALTGHTAIAMAAGEMFVSDDDPEAVIDALSAWLSSGASMTSPDTSSVLLAFTVLAGTLLPAKLAPWGEEEDKLDILGQLLDRNDPSLSAEVGRLVVTVAAAGDREGLHAEFGSVFEELAQMWDRQVSRRSKRDLRRIFRSMTAELEGEDVDVTTVKLSMGERLDLSTRVLINRYDFLQATVSGLDKQLLGNDNMREFLDMPPPPHCGRVTVGGVRDYGRGDLRSIKASQRAQRRSAQGRRKARFD
eukprot:gnl/Dysnectes_brevis/3301_a4144_664.p1 GENE.gnl/Dysnectes_brevis/3301_a4144_664~~gnl/Dysnectes_brevis/3301_a4144_664.p1  ORF type:complete len:413 (-),score=119.03 gnl/Dysnectes_brevis/3301_a4144_664:48-1115(-)